MDGGQSWLAAGELPAEPDDDLISTNDMLIGPDGHLYIAAGRSGPDAEWVYRSTEPVVVANEPDAPPTSERLVVYPNPARDFITVETDADEVEIIDVLGRVVLRTKTGAPIDVSGLPVGVYVVRAGTESRVVTVRR